MSSIEEDMATLKAEIAELQAERRAATAEERKDRLLDAITAKENRLTELIKSSAPARADPAPTDPPLFIESILDSALIIEFGGAAGSGVAISECLALTAFHGKRKIGDNVKVKTSNGVEYLANVVFAAYESNVVDIAVVKLASELKFACFVPPCLTEFVRLEQPIHVIGLKATAYDSIDQYSKISYVELIERETTLFQASYYNFDGCSGTGVVTKVVNSQFKVVGVHVATHDSTIGIGQKRKIEDMSLKQVQDDMHSICSDLHGHSAYCLICEIVRVDGLVDFLQSEKGDYFDQNAIRPK